MQTATTQRTVKARSKAPKAAVYPRADRKPPESDQGGFWLSVMLCHERECEEIKAICKTQLYHKGCDARQYALIAAEMHLRDEARAAAKYVLRLGMLPYAHAHTTYFDQQVAA